MNEKELIAILGIILPLIGITISSTNLGLNTGNTDKISSILSRLESIEIKIDKLLEKEDE